MCPECRAPYKAGTKVPNWELRRIISEASDMCMRVPLPPQADVGLNDAAGDAAASALRDVMQRVAPALQAMNAKATKANVEVVDDLITDINGPSHEMLRIEMEIEAAELQIEALLASTGEPHPRGKSQRLAAEALLDNTRSKLIALEAAWDKAEQAKITAERGRSISPETRANQSALGRLGAAVALDVKVIISDTTLYII
jgi:hypothetical protein